MVSNNKVGILGGTFNPVHLGHLLVAQNALEAFDLARVIFIPCANPPHKPPTLLAPAEHRLAMLAAAIEDDPRFEISDIEIRRDGTSYTIDTITQLKKLNPTAEFNFILGSDSLLELHLWKDVSALLKLCNFVTLLRPGCRLEATNLHFEPHLADKLMKNVAPGTQVDISSSDIRHRVAEGMSIRYLVPGEVEMYIAEHNLYAK